MPGGEAPHSFEFVAAPTDLAPYLNSLYIWRLGDEQLDDVLPAYSGQMVVFAKGVGRMQFDDEVAGGFVEDGGTHGSPTGLFRWSVVAAPGRYPWPGGRH